jgi:hypothetical protein
MDPSKVSSERCYILAQNPHISIIYHIKTEVPPSAYHVPILLAAAHTTPYPQALVLPERVSCLHSPITVAQADREATLPGDCLISNSSFETQVRGQLQQTN